MAITLKEAMKEALKTEAASKEIDKLLAPFPPNLRLSVLGAKFVYLGEKEGCSLEKLKGMVAAMYENVDKDMTQADIDKAVEKVKKDLT